MRGLLDRLIRVGIRRGWDRGVGEGQRVWIVLGTVALVARLGMRAMHREPEIVFSEKLRPGETLSITRQGPSAEGERG